MKCDAYNHDELASTKDGCPNCRISTATVDDLTLELAERITKFWRSFDTSPRRAQHKARIQVAIGEAIVDSLIIATAEEMRGEGAKIR